MREGIDSTDIALLLGMGRRFFRVRVKRWDDADWTDLTDLGGGDWVLQISAQGESPDSPAAGFSFTVLHSADGSSLSPGMSSAAENYDALSVFRPLIHPGRDVEISIAVLASGTPVSGDWIPWLRGQIEDVEWPGVEVTAKCLTLDGILVQTQIEAEEWLGSDDAPLSVEDTIQALLIRWMGAGAVVLRTIGTPGWNVARNKYPKGSLGNQLLALAQQNGWDLRYRWSEGDGAFRLTLYEPPRDKVTPDLVLTAAQIIDVPGLEQSRKYVRNAFAVEYLDVSTEARATRETSDPDSINEYGRQFMSLVEADDSPIDSAARADALLDFAKQDLARPLVDARKSIPFLPWLEVHDLVQVAADGQHFDYDTTWSVVGITHEVDGESGASTTFEGRGGQPAGMLQGWFRKARKGRTPDDIAAALGIQNFREIGRTPLAITYGWKIGSGLAESWIHNFQREQPYSEDRWPNGSRVPDVIEDDREVTFTVAIPEQGWVGYLQVEGRTADGSVGAIERALTYPSNVQGDFIAFLAVKVKQADGSVELRGWATDRARSVAYAYNVGDPDDPAPTIADAEARGGSATGGGLLIGFTSDFVTALPVGTVGYGQTIKVTAVAYIRADGTGADGSAQDHGPPVGAQDERLKITDPDQLDLGVLLERHFGDEAVSHRTLAIGAVERENIIDRAITAAKIELLGLNDPDIFGDTIIEGRMVVDGAILANHINVGTLSEIADDVGIVVSGELRNAAGTRYINLDAVGSEPWINSEKFYITADGNGYFLGELVAATGTFAGALSAATGSFTGDVTATSFFATAMLQIQDQDGGFAAAVLRQSYLQLSNLVGGSFKMQAVFDAVNGVDFTDALFYRFDNAVDMPALILNGKTVSEDPVADTAGTGFRRLRVSN